MIPLSIIILIIIITTVDQSPRASITHYQQLIPLSNAAETRPTRATVQRHHNHRPSPLLSLCLKHPLSSSPLCIVGIVDKKVTLAADAELLEPPIEHHDHVPPISSIIYIVNLRITMIQSR